MRLQSDARRLFLLKGASAKFCDLVDIQGRGVLNLHKFELEGDSFLLSSFRTRSLLLETHLLRLNSDYHVFSRLWPHTGSLLSAYRPG